MTGITGFTGERMGRGFIGGCAVAVMTSRLSTRLSGHQTVIESPQPGVGVMTGVAGGNGDNMGWPFARGYEVVVAVFAGIRGLTVIKRHDGGYPGCVGMAGCAHIAG